MLGVGLSLAAQQKPKSEGAASDIALPGLPPVTDMVGGSLGRIHGGLSDDTIAWIINSGQATRPRIAPPQRIRVSQGMSAGLVVKKVNPEYPEEARRGRIQGMVLLHVLISKAGDIAKVEVVSGDPALVPAAIEAVKQWKYKPYLLNLNPVEVDTQILINFTLSGS
jgi:periplasmic protein TonB